MWTLKKPELIPVDFPPLVTFAQVFTAEECEKIIKIGQELFPRESAILEDQQTHSAIRKGHVSWFKPEVEATHWIYHRLTDAVNAVNQGNWGFDLEGIEPLQFTIYDELADNYDSHIDLLVTRRDGKYRKLSFSLQLSPDDSYKGCDLSMMIGPEDILAPRQQGSVTFFPSVLLHKVTPITRGKRYSLVGWVSGPRFR
jgi:PKHD-type hydroxylase